MTAKLLSYLDHHVGDMALINNSYKSRYNRLKFDILASIDHDLLIAAPALAKSSDALSLVNLHYNLSAPDRRIRLILPPQANFSLDRYVSQRLEKLCTSFSEEALLKSTEFQGYQSRNWKNTFKRNMNLNAQNNVVERRHDADVLFRNYLIANLETEEIQQKLFLLNGSAPLADRTAMRMLQLADDRSRLFQRELIVETLVSEKLIRYLDVSAISATLNVLFDRCNADAVGAETVYDDYQLNGRTLELAFSFLPIRGYPNLRSAILHAPLAFTIHLSQFEEWHLFFERIRYLLMKLDANDIRDFSDYLKRYAQTCSIHYHALSFFRHAPEIAFAALIGTLFGDHKGFWTTLGPIVTYISAHWINMILSNDDLGALKPLYYRLAIRIERALSDPEYQLRENAILRHYAKDC
ncbi:MAG: hypothetical protein JJT99_02920 [Rhodobacteraceae bacterium]|nr:hypothetical protein [Paracoccaceae bacterium]